MIRYHCKARYQNAQDIINDLDNYQNNSYIPTTEAIVPSTNLHHSSPVSSANSPSESPLKSPRSLASTIGISLAVISIGGLSYFHLTSKTRQEKVQQNLIADLQQKYDSKAYQECIEMIETKKTENHPAVTPQALEFIGKCRLAEAKKEITAENYDRALEIIATIPKDDPLYNQTEMLREDSNQGIYAKAEKLYKEEGKFDEALQKINSLPEGSFRENALANTAKWKQLDSVNMATVKQVQTYLDQGNCGAAIVVTNQIDGSNYWLSQREAMYNKAEECIKNKMDKQNGALDVCTESDGILCQP